MASGFVRSVLDITSNQKFKGDLLIASLWNGASSILGNKNVPSRYKGYRTEDLIADAQAILSRSDYLKFPELQEIRNFK